MEGKIVLREAVLVGMALPVVLPAYSLRLADPPAPMLFPGLVYASSSPLWDGLFLI